MTTDVTEQARMIRDGEVSPVELVQDAIGRLEELNPQLNAVIHPLLDEAREAAVGDLPDGPFRGVPFLVKDLSCYMQGVPVHEGMRVLRDAGYRAGHDMWLTRRFRDAGFVILGRSNTPELGILPTTEPVAYGPTHNPWDLGRSPGGSSGGFGGRRSRGHRRGCARQRRRRIDPHPRQPLRAGRAEALPRTRLTRARFRRGDGRARDRVGGHAHRP
jgi:Asp-tRNA(Asn)/Glu-tRNA(Gln) amidotransferase A subunit family amidase